jgi:hypothetical protein
MPAAICAMRGMSTSGLSVGSSERRRALPAMFTAWSPTRSRSFEILSAAVMKRRSPAIGWWRASMPTQRSSTAISSRSMTLSSSNTSRASNASRRRRASTDFWTMASLRPPMSSSWLLSSSSSWSKWRSIRLVPRLGGGGAAPSRYGPAPQLRF